MKIKIMIENQKRYVFISLKNKSLQNHSKAEDKFNEAKKLVNKEGKTLIDCEKANILLSDGLKLLYLRISYSFSHLFSLLSSRQALPNLPE